MADVEELVTVGQVTAPHGVRGEVRVLPLTDFPQRFRGVKRLFVRRPNEAAPEERAVQWARLHKQFVLIKFEDVEDRDGAESLRRALVQVAPEDVHPLPDGEYYVFDIVGMQVFDESGRSLGVVRDVLFTGANDVYAVDPGDGRPELLLPAIKDVVRRIDVEKRRMDVRLLPGLE